MKLFFQVCKADTLCGNAFRLIRPSLVLKLAKKHKKNGSSGAKSKIFLKQRFALTNLIVIYAHYIVFILSFKNLEIESKSLFP